MGTLANVIIGKANWYYAPTGTTLPDEETVDLDEAWPAGWVGAFFTQDGVSMEENKNIEEQRVEELADPVTIGLDSRTLTIGLNVAEDNIDAEKLAFGGGTITTTAAASGQIGKKELVLSNTLDTVMVGVEGRNPEGFFKRYIYPTVISVGNYARSYRRNGQRITPIQFRYVGDVEDIIIVSKTANALP